MQEMIFLLYSFLKATATPEIYTLSLHDALPICRYVDVRTIQSLAPRPSGILRVELELEHQLDAQDAADRKSTRLNSSHANSSYAVFCLKKKKTIIKWCVRVLLCSTT